MDKTAVWVMEARAKESKQGTFNDKYSEAMQIKLGFFEFNGIRLRPRPIRLRNCCNYKQKFS